MELVSDFEHAKACAQTVLNIKLNCWTKLPWLLCGLGHHDAKVAQQIATKCLTAYEETPKSAQALHHPLAVALLSSEYPSRAFVHSLSLGVELAALPESFQKVVSSFKFIPIAERVVEAKHKDVKRALARLTRHTAPRVSMAVRDSVFLSLTANQNGLEQLSEAVADARRIQSLGGKLGLAGHPDLLTCSSAREARKALTNVVYRCDLPAQYFDLSCATQIDAAVKNKEKQAVKQITETSRKGKTKVTWNSVIARATALYLQDGCGSVTRPCFSIDLRLAPQVQLLPLGAVLESSSNLQSPLLLGSSHVFFSPLTSKNYSRLHRAPHAAAVGSSLLETESVLCFVHATTATAASSSEPLPVMAPSVLNSNGQSPVWVLSNLQSVCFQTASSCILEWKRVPGKLHYTLENLRYQEPLKQQRLSELLESMFLGGAVLANSKDGGRKMIFALSVKTRGTEQSWRTWPAKGLLAQVTFWMLVLIMCCCQLAHLKFRWGHI